MRWYDEMKEIKYMIKKYEIEKVNDNTKRIGENYSRVRLNVWISKK